MTGDKSGVDAVLVATFALGCGVLWRGTSLRSSVFRDWRSRSDEILAGLTQGAIDRLVRLQEETVALLGNATARFSADPGRLVGAVNDFQKALRARDKFARRVSILLRLGPTMAISALVYLIGWVIAGIYFAGFGFARHVVLRDLGLSIGGLGVAGIAGAGLGYLYLANKLASAEELAYDLTHVDEPPVAFPDAAGASDVMKDISDDEEPS
jgi:hypothetical protein